MAGGRVTAAVAFVLCSTGLPVSVAEKPALRSLARRHSRKHGNDDTEEAPSNLKWAKSAEEMLTSFGIPRTAGPEANFCRNGKLWPSFYLLGGPKCATTSASMELGRYGGIRAAPQLWSRKEWHFWENYQANADSKHVKASFLAELGECPDDARLVLGDFSVNNLAAVPAPEGLDLSACSCQKQSKFRRTKNGNGGDVPRLLSEVYGEAASNVTLMMLIREPVARIQSSWYHAKAENFASYWGFKDCCTESLNTALRTIIDASDKTQDPPAFKGKLGGEGSVWFSLFGRHIEEYLKYFDAKQLMIVPYKQYLNRDTRQPICADLRKRLSIGLNCTNHEDFHENIHPHPPLEEDLDEETMITFKNMFEPAREHLVDVLATASLRGANFPGYDGELGNKKAIEEWLRQNW